MPRRVIEHTRRDQEGDLLQVVSIFEEGVNKEQAKESVPYSRKHNVLLNKKDHYTYKSTS